MSTALGILLVAIAGLGTGTIAWPMKLMRRLQFEHYWFVGMLVGLIVIPWAVVLTTIRDPFGAYAEVGWQPLLKSNLWAIGWGIANVLYGICVVRIGAALTGAILSGLGVAAGATIPLMFKGTGLFRDAPDLTSRSGAIILAGVAVVIVGVIICTLAGVGRDRAMKGTADNTQAHAAGGFLTGVLMAALGGVLSCGASLSFVYSQGPIIEAMKSSAHGAGDISANAAVWAAGLLGGGLVNTLYPAWIMTRRRSWSMLAHAPRDVVLGAIIGTQFILAVNLLGRGMILMGVLGASIGFGIQQAAQVMGNQAVGFASGEWKGVHGAPRRLMYLAVVVLLIGVIVLVLAKKLTAH